MLVRKVAVAVASIALIVGLAACTPPMPPELKAALAEQSYTCESGVTKMFLPQEISDLGEGFVLSVEAACPEMVLEPASKAEGADLLVALTAAEPCRPFVEVPFAIDAAVIAFNIPDAASLNLDANAFAQILSGEISNWNDPALGVLNPDFALPNLPIALVPGPSAEANRALSTWFSRQASGKDFELKTNESFSVADLVPGSIAVIPHSVAFYNSLYFASVVIGDDIYTDLALADMGGIWAAASQFKVSTLEDKVGLEFDATKKAVAPEGFDVAPNPYQAVFPVSMFLCGDDSLTKRAAARFLLRQDQQGSLAASSMLNLPEFIRVEALSVVSKGLPEPELPQELIDELAN